MAMLMMMPEELTLMIYKNIYDESVARIKKHNASYEKYGFKYVRTDIADNMLDGRMNKIVNKVRDYLNENIIMEKVVNKVYYEYDEDEYDSDDLGDGDEFVETTELHYYIINDKGEKIMIRKYENTHDVWDKMSGNDKFEINGDVLGMVLEEDDYWRWYIDGHIDMDERKELVDEFYLDKEEADFMRLMMDEKASIAYDLIRTINAVLERNDEEQFGVDFYEK